MICLADGCFVTVAKFLLMKNFANFVKFSANPHGLVAVLRPCRTFVECFSAASMILMAWEAIPELTVI